MATQTNLSTSEKQFRCILSLLLATTALTLLTITACGKKCEECPDCFPCDGELDQPQEYETTKIDISPEADVPVEVTQDQLDAEEEESAECSPPVTTDCGEGEHPEYGICVVDEIHLPGGTFTMGTSGGEDNPAHDVTLSPFYIDKYEVTNRQYQACVEAGCCTPPRYDGSYTGRQPYYGNPEFDNFPVIFVTWYQAQQYCENIGKSLPTEAQWEMAARGDDGRRFPWGNESPNAARTNFNQPIDGDTNEVGSHTDGASAYGVEDMAGNVWEWTADWYDPEYYNSSPSQDPTGAESGVAKVARGGSFSSHTQEIQSYYRGFFHPEEAFSNLGFRCAGQ